MLVRYWVVDLFIIKHILFGPGNSSHSKTMSQLTKNIIITIVRFILSNLIDTPVIMLTN